MGKQRRNTYTVSICEHTCSILWWTSLFGFVSILCLAHWICSCITSRIPQYSNYKFLSSSSLVRYVSRLWNYSQLNKDNSKENTYLPQWPFHIKHKPNMNTTTQTSLDVKGASWLAKSTMAWIVPSLQLAKTGNYILTSYTYIRLTLSAADREFFCIQNSLRGTILCPLTSQAKI